MRYPDGTTKPPAVSSPFGPRTGGAFSFHYGADLVGFSRIHAVADGKVTFAGWMNSAAGYTIVVDHGGGITSLYMHNAAHHVARGDRVSEGQQIATMGRSGNATGNCNHLEIRVNGRSVEPLSYIAARLSRTGAVTTAPSKTTTPSKTNTQEEIMIVNIQGTAGKRNGGAYYIANGAATYLGATVKGLPTLNSAQADRLATRVSGI